MLALVVARVIEPASKLATHRMLHADTAVNSLGRLLRVEATRQEELYHALDWLVEQRAVSRRAPGGVSQPAARRRAGA